MWFFIPTIVYADAESPLSVQQLMFRVSFYILNPLIIFGFVAALVIFIWGMIQFLKDRENNATTSNEGKQHMLWGIVGLIIMVSSFAIMQVLADIVGADSDITDAIPGNVR